MALETTSTLEQQNTSYTDSLLSYKNNSGRGHGHEGGRRPGQPNYGSPGFGGNYNMPGRPIVSCSASDTGWEEHWRGHKNCAECLRKHSRCRETCSALTFTCEAQGVDYRGYTMRTFGRAYDRWNAERQALYSCHRQLRNCRLITCTQSSETVSSRTCR